VRGADRLAVAIAPSDIQQPYLLPVAHRFLPLAFAGALEALRGALRTAGVIVAAIALGRSSQP